MGIHTALDTNGYYGDRLSDAELEVADLVLLDLKGWDPERHRRLTGMEIGPTLEFARRLAAQRRPVWVRFVLVPGFTDDPDDVGQHRGLCGGARERRTRGRPALPPDGPLQVEGAGPRVQARATSPPPSPEAVERACASFRAAGLKAY